MAAVVGVGVSEPRACRLADGCCTAVLDAFGTFADDVCLGEPAALAPELAHAQRGAPVVYTPASDMWCATTGSSNAPSLTAAEYHRV